MAISIVLADDHHIIREGLRALLDAQARFSVIGEAGDGRSAVKMIIDRKPDVAVMDGAAISSLYPAAGAPGRFFLRAASAARRD